MGLDMITDEARYREVVPVWRDTLMDKVYGISGMVSEY